MICSTLQVSRHIPLGKLIYNKMLGARGDAGSLAKGRWALSDTRRCQLRLIIGDALLPAHRLFLTNGVYFCIFILLMAAHFRGVVMIRVKDQFVSGNRSFTAG